MSYDLHLTRADLWFMDDAPITLAEIERLLPNLPANFSIDRTGIVTAILPTGEQFSAEVGPYLICQSVSGPVHIYFGKESGPFFTLLREEQIYDLLPLADAIGAAIQGDEGERYTWDGVIPY